MMHGNDINSKLKPNKINRKNVVHTSWYEIDCWEAWNLYLNNRTSLRLDHIKFKYTSILCTWYKLCKTFGIVSVESELNSLQVMHSKNDFSPFCVVEIFTF